jgi:hypothetical protein
MYSERAVKTLVAGWFSFEQMGASAGDVLARDLVCQWLQAAGHVYDVALAPPFTGGVDWRVVDPLNYDSLVFVCGPFGNGDPVTDLLRRFGGRRLLGVNLSMLDPLESWNPFDLLLERDSTRVNRPDLTFLEKSVHVPVVGVVQIDSQREYGARDQHRSANDAIDRLVASRPMAAIRIDTRLDSNKTGMRTAEEIESLIARMDVVLTTRLHGTVLALKNGVPAVAVDPVSGGAKIRRQAEAVGWPVVLASEHLTDRALEQAYEYCLTSLARDQARACAERAIGMLADVRDQFLAAMNQPGKKLCASLP